MLRHLDLFSGIGGFALGLERTGGFQTVGFCEQDSYCQRVLKKHWPDVPIYDDVRELSGDAVGVVDIVTGGFPCQPWSVAGQQRGTEDDRDLWPEMRRIIGELRPRWVIGENVPGLDDSRFMGLDRVLSDLEGLDYEARALEIPACAVAAPHRRARLWIVAHAGSGYRTDGRNRVQAPSIKGAEGGKRDEKIQTGKFAFMGQEDIGGCGVLANASERRRGEPGSGEDKQPRRAETISASQDVAHTPEPGRQEQRPEQRGWTQPARWQPEPDVGRVANGVPNRVDRLKALGNSVVPQIPYILGCAILEAER